MPIHMNTTLCYVLFACESFQWTYFYVYSTHKSGPDNGFTDIPNINPHIYSFRTSKKNTTSLTHCTYARKLQNATNMRTHLLCRRYCQRHCRRRRRRRCRQIMPEFTADDIVVGGYNGGDNAHTVTGGKKMHSGRI